MSRRPYVIVNVAASVDGKIDTFERGGAAISSEGDRQRVDALRASVDAVMVGGHTVTDEDPRLTVKSAELRADRLKRGEPENPAKVAVLSRLGLNPGGRFVTAGPARVIVFTPVNTRDAPLREGDANAAYPTGSTLREGGVLASRSADPTHREGGALASHSAEITHREGADAASRSAETTLRGGGDAVSQSAEAKLREGSSDASQSSREAVREAGVEIFALGEGRVDLPAALAKLAELGLRRVLVEGGGTLNFELLRLGLVDEVQVFVAPTIFGGATAPTLADGAGLSDQAALRLTRINVEAQDDGAVLLRYKVEPA